MKNLSILLSKNIGLKPFLVCIISTTLLFAFTQCKNHDNEDKYDPNQWNKTIKYLNIQGSKSIFITNNNSLKSTNNNNYQQNTLYKMDENGVIAKVSYIDENGDSIDKNVYPMDMLSLSDEYMTFTVQCNDYNINGTFLLRKSDGAVFKGDNLPNNLQQDYNMMFRRTDLGTSVDIYGNIFYMHRQIIRKLDVSDPNNLKIQDYSAYNDQVFYALTDREGNCFYVGNNSLNNSMIYKYRHSVDGFTKIADQIQNVFSNPDNSKIYCIKNLPYGSYSLDVIEPSPFSLTEVIDTLPINFSFTTLVKFKQQNKNIFLGNGDIWSNTNIFELDFNTNKLTSIPLSSFGDFTAKAIYASQNYYYLIGETNDLKSIIYKVNPSDHSFTAFDIIKGFDVYSLLVDNDDELQFYAIRLSDGNPVLSKLDINGNVTVLKELGQERITYLERIN